MISVDKTSFEEAYEEHTDVVRAERTRPFPMQALDHFNLQLIAEDEFVLYAPRVTEADKLNDRKSLDRFLFSFSFFLSKTFSFLLSSDFHFASECRN